MLEITNSPGNGRDLLETEQESFGKPEHAMTVLDKYTKTEGLKQSPEESRLRALCYKIGVCPDCEQVFSSIMGEADHYCACGTIQLGVIPIIRHVYHAEQMRIDANMIPRIKV